LSSADIYREIILDYYRNPRNYGKIENPDISQKDSNPLCGDELEMHINLRENKVADVKFTGKGALQVCGSLFTKSTVNPGTTLI